MYYQLNLLLTNTPAALERVLQVIRYRGFSIDQCDMHTDSGIMRLNMQVSGEQPIHRLTSQLSKLYDLIELAPKGAEAPFDSLNRTLSDCRLQSSA